MKLKDTSYFATYILYVVLFFRPS